MSVGIDEHIDNLERRAEEIIRKEGTIHEDDLKRSLPMNYELNYSDEKIEEAFDSVKRRTQDISREESGVYSVNGKYVENSY